MTWLQRYQLRRMLRSSMWLMPALAMVAVLVLAPCVLWFDRATRWNWLNFTPEGARTILSAFTSSMLTFVVFVVSSLLIVVQLASAQLTPRVIGVVFGSPRIKWVLCAFTFAYAYTIAAAGRVDDTVPQLPVALAIGLNLVCITLFFWFAQGLGYSLRPIAMLVMIADAGLAVIENVYPDTLDREEAPREMPPPSADMVQIDHTGPTGVVLAFSNTDLIAIARAADANIELIPQVGDFLSKGDPLFRISPGRRPIDPKALHDCVAVGPERTLEQDPRFAFRIIVDIANKALSPAINDPTTAVRAVDQLHRLLTHVGRRRLDAGHVADAQGKLHLCYRTPDWADFVSLAVSEIRHFGAGSMQVAKRLRAMLEHLLRILPPARHAALRRELELLQRAAHRHFPDDEDRASATIGDLQGIGGSASS